MCVINRFGLAESMECTKTTDLDGREHGVYKNNRFGLAGWMECTKTTDLVWRGGWNVRKQQILQEGGREKMITYLNSELILPQ